jgi:hypothetical protein
LFFARLLGLCQQGTSRHERAITPHLGSASFSNAHRLRSLQATGGGGEAGQAVRWSDKVLAGSSGVNCRQAADRHAQQAVLLDSMCRTATLAAGWCKQK